MRSEENSSCLSFNGDVKNNPLRFNSSQLGSPSPQGVPSSNQHFVNFEQYHQSGKKKLTILVDESYGFEAEPEKIAPLAFHKSNEKYHEEASTPMSDLDLLSPVEHKLDNFSPYNNIIQQLHVSQASNQELKSIISDLESRLSLANQKVSNLESKVEEMGDGLKKRDKMIQNQEERLDEWMQVAARWEEQKKQVVKLQERMREKELHARDIGKLNERLKQVNKELVREVKVNEKKVRDLEGELQRSLYDKTLHNLNKMKQSSLKIHTNKQNINNAQPRKSLQRKKSTNSNPNPHRKSQRLSSSSTLLTKKLLPK